ncbi:MAG: hypothetical protein L6R40_004276 [Gallowayella cf. fulva]|nr:MAG: hypothetical protein L6R40_004276 [Xanthomendoza cf. fulva]
MLAATSLFLSLLPLALGSPIAPRETTQETPIQFGIIAARSASPVHLQSVNANGQAFWIGKDTATYCPLNPASQCPPGNLTVFAAGNGGASLYDVVPGGQQIYVAPNGKLSYTQAHSGYIPPGSAVQTFNATKGTVNGQLGSFTFKGLGGSGFLACPSKKSKTNGYPYQVFVDVAALSDKDVPSGCKKDCLGFSALTAPYDGQPAAWQYT